jgi:SAM-dependent methyltransferase
METGYARYEQKVAPTQRVDAWNEIATGWHEWIPDMHKWYLPATDLMLDLAHIEIGDRILDVAAGDCDQTIEAAKRVSPKGYVLAIDLAPDMLEIGAQVARASGLCHIETRVMDAQNLDLPEASFDAAICRFGLMLLPDPIGALKGISRVLAHGDRVSIVVYADRGDPEFVTAVSVVRRLLGWGTYPSSAKDLGTPEGLQRTLESGGLRNVESHLLHLPVILDSAHECVRYLQATSPTLVDMVSQMSFDNQRKAWEEVEEALAKYEDNGRFEVEHRVIVAGGSAM